MQPLPEDFDPEGSKTSDTAAIFQDLVGCSQVMCVGCAHEANWELLCLIHV